MISDEQLNLYEEQKYHEIHLYKPELLRVCSFFLIEIESDILRLKEIVDSGKVGSVADEKFVANIETRFLEAVIEARNQFARVWPALYFAQYSIGAKEKQLDAKPTKRDSVLEKEIENMSVVYYSLVELFPFIAKEGHVLYQTTICDSYAKLLNAYQSMVFIALQCHRLNEMLQLLLKTEGFRNNKIEAAQRIFDTLKRALRPESDQEIQGCVEKLSVECHNIIVTFKVVSHKIGMLKDEAALVEKMDEDFVIVAKKSEEKVVADNKKKDDDQFDPVNVMNTICNFVYGKNFAEVFKIVVPEAKDSNSVVGDKK